MMLSIREAVGRALTWQQPRWGARQYELRADAELLATLRWPTLFGPLAMAETAQGRWTITRTGCLHPRVTVRVDGSEADLAVFEARWLGGGTLTMTGGASYRLGAANIWHTRWHWRDAVGAPLAQVAGQHGVSTLRARVELLPAGADLADLDVLVTVGWYVLVVLADDGSGAASGAVIPTTSAG